MSSLKSRDVALKLLLCAGLNSNPMHSSWCQQRNTFENCFTLCPFCRLRSRVLSSKRIKVCSNVKQELMIHKVHRKLMKCMNSSIPASKGKKLRDRVVRGGGCVGENRKTLPLSSWGTSLSITTMPCVPSFSLAVGMKESILVNEQKVWI